MKYYLRVVGDCYYLINVPLRKYPTTCKYCRNSIIHPSIKKTFCPKKSFRLISTTPHFYKYYWGQVDIKEVFNNVTMGHLVLFLDRIWGGWINRISSPSPTTSELSQINYTMATIYQLFTISPRFCRW